MGTMQGKICLITGGTNGIGKAAATGLARMGATVIIVGRNASKTAQVVEEIKAKSASQTVDSLLADLSSQADIRRLVDAFKRKYSQLHVLLNNAGGINDNRQLTVDGIELTFALNHLAYFLVTNLLLDTLKASTPARIINVSSLMHRNAHLDFDNLQGERQYQSMAAYAASKLENLLFTAELSHRLQGTGVTVNALHPGWVYTGPKHHAGLLNKFMDMAGPILASKPDKGASTSVYLASSPEVEGISGKYFSNARQKPPAPQANDVETARKLWDVSARMVGLGRL